MKPVLVSSGEPAGIGPDICLGLANSPIPLVVLGDKAMLADRASRLGLSVQLIDFQPENPVIPKPDTLTVWSIPCQEKPIPGKLDVRNAHYVLNLLTQAAKACQAKAFSALVTAPVHKGIINEAGILFTGHTEFLANFYKIPTVVMILACQAFKVALITTHLPLKAVPEAVTADKIKQVMTQLVLSLQNDFGIKNPHVMVAGLNPHAGEGGYLGREEIDIIAPALDALRAQGMSIDGPLSADTLFSQENLQKADAFVAMYHDQGLPVLKYAGFGDAVNITAGLPIVRTSVDHGTALDLAGTGKAQTGSLLAAVDMAAQMATNRE